MIVPAALDVPDRTTGCSFRVPAVGVVTATLGAFVPPRTWAMFWTDVSGSVTSQVRKASSVASLTGR